MGPQPCAGDGWGLRVLSSLPLGTPNTAIRPPEGLLLGHLAGLKKYYCAVQFEMRQVTSRNPQFSSRRLGGTGIKTGQADCAGSTALEGKESMRERSETKGGGEERFRGLVFRHGVGV